MDDSTRKAVEQGIAEILAENRNYEATILAQKQAFEEVIGGLEVEITSLHAQLASFHADPELASDPIVNGEETYIEIQLDEDVEESFRSESH